MSGHSTYQPQSAFMKWMERRLPIAGLVYSSFVAYPVPRTLNYWWTFGGILAFLLGSQIVTGIVLVMHYTPQDRLLSSSPSSVGGRPNRHRSLSMRSRSSAWVG